VHNYANCIGQGVKNKVRIMIVVTNKCPYDYKLLPILED
jgi:hypothetical protein